MITEKDLQEAIAECQGTRTPNSATCIKLAAFYTIKEHLYPEKYKKEDDTFEFQTDYSYGINENALTVGEFGDTEFLKKISGMNEKRAWELMDELMTTIQVVNPRLYNGVLRRIP